MCAHARMRENDVTHEEFLQKSPLRTIVWYTSPPSHVEVDGLPAECICTLYLS